MVAADPEVEHKRKNDIAAQDSDAVPASSKSTFRRASLGQFLRWGRSGQQTPLAKGQKRPKMGLREADSCMRSSQLKDQSVDEN